MSATLLFNAWCRQRLVGIRDKDRLAWNFLMTPSDTTKAQTAFKNSSKKIDIDALLRSVVFLSVDIIFLWISQNERRQKL